MPGEPTGTTGDPLSDALQKAVDRISALEGAGQFWPGMIGWTAASVAPPGWLIADGSTFDADRYAALAAVLGGNTLPNMIGRMPIGAGTTYPLLSAGGGATVSIGVANLPSHTHTIGGSTGAEAAHTHSGTTGAGSAHSHNTAATVVYNTGGAGGNLGSAGNYNQGSTATSSESAHTHGFTTGAGSSHSHTLPAATGAAGSGTSLGILNPYIALTPLIHV